MKPVVFLGALCAALIAGPSFALAEACRDTRVALKGDWGKAEFRVDVADDAAERSQGLMFVETMPRDKGMLFLYETPQHATFWMRNTLISLDMIFVGPDGVVQHVHENAIPKDETVIDGGRGIVAVLEINGGLAAQFGIAPGDVLRHPFFGAEAAWPCPS